MSICNVSASTCCTHVHSVYLSYTHTISMHDSYFINILSALVYRFLASGGKATVQLAG